MFQFALMVFEGILAFSPQSSLFLRRSRYTKRIVHWVLTAIGNTCALLGLAAIYINKNNNSKGHFTTWHGLIGIITVVYAVLQSVGGSSLMLGILPPGITIGRMKAYHATSGLFLFALMCASLILGMFSTWFASVVDGTSWYACIVCPMVMALVISNQVTNAYASQEKNV